MTSRSERIAALNDVFRKTFLGGRVMMTAGVAALPEPDQAKTVKVVKAFENFDADNDPHGEHDFGAFEVGGRKLFWKIDYHDRALEFGSEDPCDPSRTTRVLTIMLAEEY